MSLNHQLLLLCVVVARCFLAEEVSDDGSIFPIRSQSNKLGNSVIEGGDVTLICGIDYQEDGNLAIYWRRGNDMLSINTNVLRKRPGKPYMIHNGGKELEIVSVQREDEGDYTCSVSHVPPLNQTHHLSVYYISTIDLKPSPIKDHIVGQPMVLTCTGEGNPIPRANWTFDGKPTDIFGEKVRIRPNGELIIDVVTLDNAGLYECTLYNKAGQLREAVGVSVFASPFVEIKPHNGNVTAKQGEDVSFSCSLNARGNIRPSWYFQGQPLKTHENELTLTKVQKRDQGKYECKFSTQVYDTIGGRFYLNVLSPDGEAAAIEHTTTPNSNDANTKRRLQLISIVTVVVLSIFLW